MSSKNRLDVYQNAIESSGFERTMISCALKMALRKINKNSMPNFLIYDEITGKVDDKNINILIDLLNIFKTYIDKLIIIEHINDLPFDVMIEVIKNEEGISSLKIKN